MAEIYNMVKDLNLLLKDFKQIVEGCDTKWRSRLINGNNLEKKSDDISIEGGGTFYTRYRESWPNWLLCAAFNYARVGLKVFACKGSIS
jgi:hypothetical protein